jgi:hypothetical protein
MCRRNTDGATNFAPPFSISSSNFRPSQSAKLTPPSSTRISALGFESAIERQAFANSLTHGPRILPSNFSNADPLEVSCVILSTFGSFSGHTKCIRLAKQAICSHNVIRHVFSLFYGSDEGHRSARESMLRDVISSHDDMSSSLAILLGTRSRRPTLRGEPFRSKRPCARFRASASSNSTWCGSCPASRRPPRARRSFLSPRGALSQCVPSPHLPAP